MRHRRQRTAAPAAARLPADARDVAPDRAAPRRAFHGRVQRSARLRRFGEARRRRAQRQLFEAGDGGGPGRGDARARLRALPARGTRSRRARRRIACASIIRTPSSASRVLDISPTRIMYGEDRQGVRDRVLPLVLPDPAVRSARAVDRRRPGLLPATRSSPDGARPACRSSTRAPSRNTSAASAIPRRCMRPARITARPRRSISSTMPPTRPRASTVRCSSSGARRVSSTACSIRSPTGVASRPTCAARSLPSGHYLAEEAPEETLAELVAFLDG